MTSPEKLLSLKNVCIENWTNFFKNYIYQIVITFKLIPSNNNNKLMDAWRIKLKTQILLAAPKNVLLVVSWLIWVWNQIRWCMKWFFYGGSTFHSSVNFFLVSKISWKFSSMWNMKKCKFEMFMPRNTNRFWVLADDWNLPACSELSDDI